MDEASTLWVPRFEGFDISRNRGAECGVDKNSRLVDFLQYGDVIQAVR